MKEKAEAKWYLSYQEYNKTGTKIWCHRNVPIFSKNWNLYKEQKGSIYRRRNLWKNDLSLTCVPLKSSIWLLKLIFTQLPAINDSEYQILFHINNANISLKFDIRIITKSVLRPKSDPKCQN